MSTDSTTVQKTFMNGVKQSQAAESRVEATKELKKMIAFNSQVVTELVADIKGESSETASEELIKEEELQIEGDDNWDSIEMLRKK